MNERLVPRQFAAFLGVGTIGFAVDALLFALTHVHLEWPIPWARGFSALCAITITWALNRHTTFADRQSKDRAAEYWRYLVSQALGLLVNLGTFGLLVAFVAPLESRPFLALAAGAGLAVLANFLTARKFVFKERSELS